VRLIWIYVLATAMAAACSLSGPVPPSTLPETAGARGLATNGPTAAISSRTASAPSPFSPFVVSTWAANVLLRSNPGYLFAQIGVLAQGTALTVLGRSPGGEWLLVTTGEGRVGWVFGQLVDVGGGNVAVVPVVQPPAVQEVVGTVEDQAGMPISGIQFSLLHGTGSGAPRNDAMTDETGTFHAFMPPTAQGTWDLSFTAVSCKSNTMDANCNCVGGACGRPDPERMSLVLPQEQGAVLAFVWK